MDPLMGDIELFAFDYAPMYWMACEGQTLSIPTYEALYSLMGTTFGGDGINNFCLPDLRKALPMQSMGMHYCIAVMGMYPDRT
jgi:microcystin-dependent protein